VSMDEQYQKLDEAVGFLFSFDPSIEPTNLDKPVGRHQELGLKPEHFELFRASFLAALSEAKITDSYSQDAWRAVLDPALAFMSDKACREAVKLAS
jgi:hemoglobin-like flavoprotein